MTFCVWLLSLSINFSRFSLSFYIYIYRHTIYLFYFWLCWVWFFSSCGEWRLFSSWSAWGYSLCRGFSCCGAQAQYLWRTGLVAPQHVGSSWTRDRTMSRTLAGGFFTTEPPGKSKDDSYMQCGRFATSPYCQWLVHRVCSAHRSWGNEWGSETRV